MDGKLTLNDGTELEYSTVTQAGNVLWVYCYAPVTFGQLFWLLNTLLIVIWNFNRFASE